MTKKKIADDEPIVVIFNDGEKAVLPSLNEIRAQQAADLKEAKAMLEAMGMGDWLDG